MRTEDGYKELYAELRGYEEKGVDIVMDGYPMSPLQIVTHIWPEKKVLI